MDILDLKDYGPENNRNYGYILVVIDNFTKFGFTVPLKNKSAQAVDSFERILISSKRKPNLIETDDGGEIVSKIFSDFLKKNNIRRYNIYIIR